MSTFSEPNHARTETEETLNTWSNSITASGTWSSNMQTTLGTPDLLDGTFPTSPNGDGNVSPTPLKVSDTVPPNNLNRTLVLCFDGTGDQFDSDNSNIVELFSMLKKDDPNKQLVYYQAGIGTYTSPEIATPFASSVSKTLDMMIAWNIDAHIMSGYEFLMQNYHTGDKICIFGFSRGAYTARCLAGMIHKVGLLPTCNHQQVPFAYKMYTRCDHEGWHQSNAFKKAFAIDVDIEFLGVWDTVNSVGLIPRHLPFTTSNSVVKTFRHAIALDERRAKFKANHWNRPTEDEKKLSLSDRQKRALDRKAKDEAKNARKAYVKEHPKESPKSIEHMEAKHSKGRLFETDVDEVWFAGCHCDIGGGSVTNGELPCLARIPLRWMIRQCFLAKTGILFYKDGLKGVNLDPDTLYPVVLQRPPPLPLNTFEPDQCTIKSIPKSAPTVHHEDDDDDELYLPPVLKETEEEADLKDSLAPVYDQLSLAPHWWLLEMIPIRQHYQDSKADGNQEKWEWHSKIRWNMGEGRHIPKQRTRGVKIHRTVKTRMEAVDEHGKSYNPGVCNLALDCVTWVD